MRFLSARLAIVVAALVSAAGAFAQSNPVAREPQAFSQEGFFRPTPDGDPSLTKYRPPAAASLPTAAPQPVRQVPQASAMYAAPQEPAIVRGPDSNPLAATNPVEQQRWAEEQLDRTEREAQRDRQRALETPPPVAPGAYDGTTSERNR